MATSCTPSTTASGRKTILIAEHSGFCHGVKRAVNQTLALADPNQDSGERDDRPVYVLGQLIHNRQVIAQLEDKNIHTVSSLDEVPEGSICVIRTHGAPPEIVEAAEARGIEVSDATCPDVRLVQNKAVQLAEEGYTVVIVGKDDHPEVIGIKATSARIPGSQIIAINSVEEIATKVLTQPHRRIGVVSQTTQLEETFFDMVKELSKVAKELKVFNTICPATFYRQNSALELAGKVDFMIVVGGKNSSNTTHLADICKAAGTDTIHIETRDDLAGCEGLANAQRVGITAGASTPDWIVQDVIEFVSAM